MFQSLINDWTDHRLRPMTPSARRDYLHLQPCYWSLLKASDVWMRTDTRRLYQSASQKVDLQEQRMWTPVSKPCVQTTCRMAAFECTRTSYNTHTREDTQTALETQKLKHEQNLEWRKYTAPSFVFFLTSPQALPMKIFVSETLGTFREYFVSGASWWEQIANSFDVTLACLFVGKTRKKK